MTQKELNRHVASRTGEELREIRRRGFSILDPLATDEDDELDYPPQVIDWDELDRIRRT